MVVCTSSDFALYDSRSIDSCKSSSSTFIFIYDPQGLLLTMPIWLRFCVSFSCGYVPLHVCHLNKFLVEGLTVIQFATTVISFSNLLLLLLLQGLNPPTRFEQGFFSSFLFSNFSSLASKELEAWNKSMVAYKKKCTQILKIEEEFLGGKV